MGGQGVKIKSMDSMLFGVSCICVRVRMSHSSLY